MNRSSMLRAAAAAAGVLALGQAAPALAATPAVRPQAVHCGQTVTVNVTLTANLTCTGLGLLVDGNDITVNLGGHTISGTGVGVELGQPAAPLPADDDEIENGKITGFGTAVQFDFTENTVLADLTVTGAGAAGATVINTFSNRGPVEGILVDKCKFTSVGGPIFNASIELDSGFQVLDSSFDGGSVVLSQTTSPTFTGDTFTGTPVDLDEEGDATFETNKFVNSPVTDQGAFGNDVFEHNTFSKAGTALTISDMFNEQVADNTFTGNGIGAEVDSDNAAFGGDSITGDVFTRNTTAGLLVDYTAGSAVSLTVSGNTATSNGATPNGAVDAGGNPVADGLHIYAPDGDPTVSDNQTGHNHGYGIWSIPGTVTGTGNVSTDDHSGCNPTTLCTY